VIGGRAQGSISVTANNVCRSGTLNRHYTKTVLEYRIEVNYLAYSLYDLTGEVTVSSCGAGRRRRRDADDVIVTVTVRGEYESVFSRTISVDYRPAVMFMIVMCGKKSSLARKGSPITGVRSQFIETFFTNIPIFSN